MSSNQKKNPKSNMDYSGDDIEFGSDEDDLEDFVFSSRKASRKQLNANHLLNFHVERPLQPKTSSKNTYYKKNIPFVSQGQFVQANFQFIVETDFPYEENPDQFVQWEQVKIVICNEGIERESTKCPICLDVPVAPRITRCGHIFCWTCLLRMFQSTLATSDTTKTIEMPNLPNLKLEVDQKFKQCPICTEMIALHQLKPVKIRIEANEYKENNFCEFILLRRHKSSCITQTVENYSPKKETSLPEFDLLNANFSRFYIDSDHKVISEQLKEEYSQMQFLRQNGDEDEIQYIDLGILQIESYLELHNNQNESKSNTNTQQHLSSDNKQKKLQNVADYFHVYQESSGQKIFLHPFCSRALLNEYKSFVNVPTKIKGKILEIEEITIDHAVRKRFKFLSHLPLHYICKICEIDMRPIVSKKALEPLLPKIMKRVHARKQKKFLEHKQDKKREKAQSFVIDEPIVLDPNDFLESLSTISQSSEKTEEIEDTNSPSIKPSAPVWVKDTPKKNTVYIPKKLQANTQTTIRKVKGSDGESDEELAAPSFSSSVYQDISFEPVPVQRKSSKRGGGKKKRGKKQMLFSTSQLSYF